MAAGDCGLIIRVILGALAKLRKRILTSLYLYLRPFVHMEKLGSHWMDAYEI
jgi:hypothetical protein